jgi:hypothetical protein
LHEAEQAAWGELEMQAILQTAPERRQPTIREFVVIKGGVEPGSSHCNKPTRSAIAIGVTLIMLQILDGILTHMGVMRFGMHAEYNLLLRELMTAFNPAAVLTCLKLFAVVVIVLLTIMSSRFNWVKNAMAGLCVFYLVIAVIPWVAVLFFHHPA